MSDAERDLNSGPVGRQMLRVSAPMSVGILGVLAVGLADAFFLARLGSTELTAIGFVYPVIVAASGFSVGMSAGANAALSQAMGRGSETRDVARLALHAVGFGLVLGVAIASALWLVASSLFALLGAKDAVLDAVLAYLPWWLLSFPILLATMVLGSAFRAAGDGVTPASIMVLTAVINIALTPALIFGIGPIAGLGMAGAGIATLLARCVAFALSLTLAIRRGSIGAGRRPLEGAVASIRAITAIGLPAAGSRGINPAGMAIVTAAVATLGDQAVAGFGAAARVQAIAIVPFFALASGIAPVIGQAWGGERTDRVQQAVRLSLWFVVIYGVALGAALWAFATPLANLMTANGDAATYTARYLQIVGWSLGGYGIVLAINAALTARSRAAWALGLSLTRIGLFYVPLAWIGVLLFGYTGILIAALIANALAAWGGLIAATSNNLLISRAWPITRPSQRLLATRGRS